MSDLKNELIKLGSTNPELRTHLRPVLAALKVSAANVFKPSNSTTVEVLSDGSVEYSDEAGSESFKSIKDAISHTKDLVGNGSGEWWADDAKKALAWLKKQ